MTEEVSFTQSVAKRLKIAGLARAHLAASSFDASSFGNAEATFRIDSLVLRIVRDRGQEFLDLASSATPDQFFQFGDVQIAMGWKTIDDVVAKTQPDELQTVFVDLAQHLAELEDAFSAGRERFTRAKLARAARDRGQAFVNRLRGTL